MRIAFVCLDPGVPVFGRKGSSIHCQEIIRAFRQRGAEVELFATRFGEDVPTDLQQIPTNQLAGKLARQPAAREQALIGLNPLVASLLINAKQFDLVYERYSLWSFAAMQFAHERGIPGILEVNAPLIREQNTYRTLVDEATAKQIREKCFRFADSLIAVSEQVAEIIRPIGEAQFKTTAISNGVNLEHFNRHQSVKRNSEETVIGFVGTLKPWHGVSNLIDSFAIAISKNPKLRLRIVGAGPEEQKLKEQVESYPDAVQQSVQWLGAVPNSEIPDIIATFDIAVAPYPELQNFYFSPLKILEYMAAGRAVIASRIGQIPDLIQPDITGKLVTPGCIHELASEILQLSADSQSRARLGSAARKSVEANHSWCRVVDRILKTVPPSKLHCETC